MKIEACQLKTVTCACAVNSLTGFDIYLPIDNILKIIYALVKLKEAEADGCLFFIALFYNL